MKRRISHSDPSLADILRLSSNPAAIARRQAKEEARAERWRVSRQNRYELDKKNNPHLYDQPERSAEEEEKDQEIMAVIMMADLTKPPKQ